MYNAKKAQISATKPVFNLIQKPIPVTYIGAGKVKQMGNIVSAQKLKKVLVITDKVLLSLGLLDGMLESLKDKNIEVVIYDGVKPDPTFGIVEEAIEVYKTNKCEGVIAFGGGSTLDASKTVASAVANNCSPRSLEGLLKAKKDSVPFIAVPTTAGTGSEVTIVAVISDDVSHKKTTIISPKLVPTVAVLDPELTTGLPGHITSTTGLDALTHALESYVSEYSNAETTSYALKAINLITSNIEIAYNDPTNLEARENLLVGSFYAGMAFTRTYVGYVHAFAHNAGGKYGIPHGLACAVFLPHVMKSYKEECKEKFAYLADFLELAEGPHSVNSKAECILEYLFTLNKNLGIPERLEKFPKDGVDEILVAGFAEAHGTYPVPHYYTKAEALEILNKVCAE